MMPTSGPIVPSRKRAVLVIIAVMQLMYTISVMLPPFRADTEFGTESFAFDLVPLEARGIIWLGLGVLAIALAPTKLHRAGWVAVMVMPMTRMVGNGWTLFMFIVPAADPGDVTAIPNTIFWLAWSALVWGLAGWPDLTEHVRGMGRGAGRYAKGHGERDITEAAREVIRAEAREIVLETAREVVREEAKEAVREAERVQRKKDNGENL